MPARVFISCGQATKEQKQMAEHIGGWFEMNDYTAFVATQVPTIFELNSQNNR
jgi:hypothetical protein